MQNPVKRVTSFIFLLISFDVNRQVDNNKVSDYERNVNLLGDKSDFAQLYRVDLLGFILYLFIPADCQGIFTVLDWNHSRGEDVKAAPYQGRGLGP